MTFKILLRRVALAAGLLWPAIGIAADPSFLDRVHQGLVGTWQNTDDPRLTREFSADGSVTDRFDGDSESSLKGTWFLFSGTTPPPEAKPYKMQPVATYMEIKQNGDVLIFGFTNLTAQTMRMVYLQQGKELSFARIK